MAGISFEEAFGDTMQSLGNGRFRLPSATAEAVYDYLKMSRHVYLTGYLDRATTCPEYTETLTKRTRRLLNDPNPYPLVSNGYKLAERILTYHCRRLWGDRRQQERVDRVMKALWAHIAERPNAFLAIATRYIEAYRTVTTIDLFAEDGRPIGRAAIAARTVADHYKGRPQWRRVTYILNELRRLTQELDQPTG